MKKQLKEFSSLILTKHLVKYIVIFILVLASLKLISQGRNDRYKGVVLDYVTGLKIDSVKLQTIDTAFIFYTNNKGFYSFKLPKEYDSVIALKIGYDRSIIKPGSRPKRIIMNPLYKGELKYNYLNNSVLFYPVKIPLGSFMVAYERSLSYKYSLLLMMRYFYNGQNLFGSEIFTGYEISLGARKFFSRNASVGYYIQAKAIFAHFNFSRLNYQYLGKYTKSISEEFNTLGGAFGIGFANRIGGSRHIIIDISFSAKILLHNYPSEITDEHGVKYVHNPTWWYIGGPGSLIEFNLGIGGLW